VKFSSLNFTNDNPIRTCENSRIKEKIHQSE